MSGSLDKKGFSAKDVIYIVILVLSLAGSHYTVDARITMLEQENIGLRQNVESNGKLIKTIYLGLIASGAIKPPQ